MPETPQDHRAKVFISAQELARLRGSGADIIVLAIRNPEAGGDVSFANAERIPGAADAFLPSELASPPSPVAGNRPLPSITDLQRNARRWGVRKTSAVVVYDHESGLNAGRAWWVLRWAGIPDVRLLDGGFAAWQKAGLPTTRSEPTPAPGDVEFAAGHLPVLSGSEAAALARSGILLDSRITPNYEGGPTAPGEPPRGHIPGAISVPAPDNLTAAGHFADAATLAALYRSRGVNGERKVGVYCGVGISAAFEVAVLASLGIEAAMFPGSWSAWSANSNNPVARGPEPG